MDSINYEGIRVRLHNEEKNRWLSLPVNKEELHSALTEMNALDGNFSVDKCRDGFGGRLEPLIVGGSLEDANYLAMRIEEAEPKFLTRLAAVMDSPEKFTDIRRLIDYTYNESYYDLFTNVHSTEDLARHYIYDSGLIQMPAEWAEGIDLQQFGANLEKHEVGHYTEHGYLIPTGAEWVQVYEVFNAIPKDYELPLVGAQPVTPVYPHSLAYATEHDELDLWRKNSDLNVHCARAMDAAIIDCNYKLHHYDFKSAANSVIAEFGAERVAFVLANVLQRYNYDGRYSVSNKGWAKEFSIPRDWSPGISTHPALMNGFIDKARTILEELENHNPLATVEMSTEQNYNMIDGARNNLAVPKADLTDGQTLDEIKELAPETLPDEKPSVVEKLREARGNPDRQPDVGAKKHTRSGDEREL